MKNPFKPNNSTTFSSPEHQSAGIFDDFAVRKVVQTQEGTIEKTPTQNNHIVNKAYADSISGAQAKYLLISGANASGNLNIGESGLISTGTISGANIAISSLTNGQVAYISGGKIFSNGGLTYNSDKELVVTGGLGIGGNNDSGFLMTITKNTGSAACKFQSSTYDAYFLIAGPSNREQFFAFANYNSQGSPIFQVGMRGNNRFVIGDNNFTNEYFKVLSGGGVYVNGKISGATLTAANGFTGTGAYTNFTISGGIVLAAS